MTYIKLEKKIKTSVFLQSDVRKQKFFFLYLQKTSLKAGETAEKRKDFENEYTGLVQEQQGYRR